MEAGHDVAHSAGRSIMKYHSLDIQLPIFLLEARGQISLEASDRGKGGVDDPGPSCLVISSTIAVDFLTYS